MKKFITWLRRIFGCKKESEVIPTPSPISTSVPTLTPEGTFIPNVTPTPTNTENCGFDIEIDLAK